MDTLINTLKKSDGHLGLNSLHWFGLLLDEELVGFGSQSKQMLDAEIIDHLLTIMDAYRLEIKNGYAFADVSGRVYDALYDCNLVIESHHSLLADFALRDDQELTRISKNGVGSAGTSMAMLNRINLLYGASALRQLSLTCVDPNPHVAKMLALELMYNVVSHDIEIAEFSVYAGLVADGNSELVTHYVRYDLRNDTINTVESNSKATECSGELIAGF